MTIDETLRLAKDVQLIEARALYMQSAEVYTAVHNLTDIALRFRRAANAPAALEELKDDLIRFFGIYDRMRTDEVESLKDQLRDALQWSVKPTLVGTVL